MAYNAAKYMADKRAKERDLVISKPADPIRRRDCSADTYEFLKVYFGGIFSQPFTATRREMVDGIEHAARYGGDQAVAGPRGDGKTRSALFVALKLELAGLLRFPIIISKSGPRATRELKNLKDAMRASKLLAADFPEVMEPIIALGGWASKARQQTAYGEFTNLEWGEECVIFPTIRSELLDWESSANGQIFASLGIEGPIRGYSVRNERPDLALLDDIDDRESARSEMQTENRSNIIEEDIGGLAGPDKTIARVMLCTAINRTCIAFIYTDKQKKPSWRGQRHKLIETLPDRMDLVEEYIALRQGRGDDDPDARKAHEFYLANRTDIEAGSVLTNPYRFDPRPLADGEPGQVSALQFCLDLIADRTWEHFNTEFQNDPPAEDEDKLILTAYHIQDNCGSGYQKRVVPEGTVAITIGADVQKLGLHYVVIAWLANGAGLVIDYDFFEFMTEGKKAADCEVLILEGLQRWKDMLDTNPFRAEPNTEFSDGEPFFADIVLIDMGWKEETWNTQPVQVFCAQAGIEKYRPSKGQPNYRRPKQRGIKIGDNWHIDRIGRTKCVMMNTDHWKLKVHEGFLSDSGEPGSLRLFEKPRINGRVHRNFHLSYAKHIASQFWDHHKLRFTEPTKADHYFDSTYEAIVGRSICGIHVVPQSAGPPVPPPSERPTAAQLAGRK